MSKYQALLFLRPVQIWYLPGMPAASGQISDLYRSSESYHLIFAQKLLIIVSICLSYYKNAYINRKTQQKKISTMADILPILNINCSETEVIIRSDIYYSCKTYNGLATQPQVATVWSSQNVRTTKFNPLITRKKVFIRWWIVLLLSQVFCWYHWEQELFFTFYVIVIPLPIYGYCEGHRWVVLRIAF